MEHSAAAEAIREGRRLHGLAPPAEAPTDLAVTEVRVCRCRITAAAAAAAAATATAATVAAAAAPRAAQPGARHVTQPPLRRPVQRGTAILVGRGTGARKRRDKYDTAQHE